jgi:hypothetical protein
MALIRRRWPGAQVDLGQYQADIWTNDKWSADSDGATDVERLANAVVAAMEAERE